MTDEPIHSPIRPVADEHAHVPADYEAAAPLDLPAILSRAEGATPGPSAELRRQIEILRKAAVPVPDEHHDFTLERALRGAESWRTMARNTVAAYDAAEAEAQALRALVPVWRGIESAPKDGAHILACQAGNHFGFGMDGTPWPAVQAVVHWWGVEGEEGFYTSVNEMEPQHPFPATHWKPLDSPGAALALPAVPGGCLEDQERLAAKDDAAASPQAPVGVSEPSEAVNAEWVGELADRLELIAPTVPGTTHLNGEIRSCKHILSVSAKQLRRLAALSAPLPAALSEPITASPEKD